MELGLGEFTKQIKQAQKFLDLYEHITDELANYLSKEEKSFEFSKINKEKFYTDLSVPEKYLPASEANKLTKYYNKWLGVRNIHLITLNYTRSIESIIGSKGVNSQIGSHSGGQSILLRSLEHLHGYIDERMILGVDDVSQISNQEFRDNPEIIEAFVKPISNKASKSTIDDKCGNLIKSADLIFVFGCSLGITEKMWWMLMGEQLRRGMIIVIFKRGSEINRRHLYKLLPLEREIKQNFLNMTDLNDSEKKSYSENIIVAINTEIFSHMRSD